MKPETKLEEQIRTEVFNKVGRYTNLIDFDKIMSLITDFAKSQDKIKVAEVQFQPKQIEDYMKDKFKDKMINDEFGWVGEFSISPKNVLDLIIDLTKNK